MKMAFVFCLHVLIAIGVLGCSKKVSNVRLTSDETMSGRRDKLSDRRIRIDSAFALWYVEQLGAASQIENILDVKLRNIDIERDPEDLLQEQRKYISEVEIRSFPEKADLDVALTQWHEYQYNAANCLRKVLAKPPIIADGKQNSEFILDLQLRDVAALKEELVKLGYEHWKQEK